MVDLYLTCLIGWREKFKKGEFSCEGEYLKSIQLNKKPSMSQEFFRQKSTRGCDSALKLKGFVVITTKPLIFFITKTTDK